MRNSYYTHFKHANNMKYNCITMLIAYMTHVVWTIVKYKLRAPTVRKVLSPLEPCPVSYGKYYYQMFQLLKS